MPYRTFADPFRPMSNVLTASPPVRDGDCSDPQPIRCKGCLQWQACGITEAERFSFVSSRQCYSVAVDMAAYQAG